MKITCTLRSKPKLPLSPDAHTILYLYLIASQASNSDPLSPALELLQACRSQLAGDQWRLRGENSGSYGPCKYPSFMPRT